MDQIGQYKLYTLDRYHVLSRAFQMQDIINSRVQKKSLVISDFFETFQYQAIYSITGTNSTLRVQHKAPSCQVGNDVRCRYWYAQSAQQESLQMYPPNLVYGQKTASLSSLSCQRMMLFNKTTQKEEMQSVICLGLRFNQTQNYFQNYASSTKQVYFLEPTSQILLYDSQEPLGVTQIETLDNQEFFQLKSQSDAINFNDTLKNNYQNPIFRNVSKLNTEYIDEVNQYNQTFSYNRNGTQTIVIMNPVYVIEKLPQFSQFYGNQQKSKANQYLIKTPYIQVNIISNENLKLHAKKIEDFFQIYFLIFNILFGFLGLISIFLVIYYAFKIRNIFYISIKQLTEILVKMNDKELSQDIFDIATSEQQLSLDTYQLYESFKQIYQIMLYSSEDFYNQNETEQLLKLNKSIEFFKQFRNMKAVGITFNNLGSILLKQGHYFQALENFQSSVIYAKYEIQEYCLQNSNLSNLGILQSTCFFNDDQQGENDKKEEKKEVRMSCQSIAKKSLANKVNRDQNKSIFSAIKPNKSKKFKESSNTSKDFVNEGKVIEELNEEEIDLLNNLYQRERNYITSLLALQEQCDCRQKIIGCQNLFNFWYEIKKLCKNLLKISRYLPYSKQIEVETNILISKCYFNMENPIKSQQILLFSKKKLNHIQKIEKENNNLQSPLQQSIYNFNEKMQMSKQSIMQLPSQQTKKLIRAFKSSQKNNFTLNIFNFEQNQLKITSNTFQKEEEDTDNRTYNQLFLSNQHLNPNPINFSNEMQTKDQKQINESSQSNYPFGNVLVSPFPKQLKHKFAQLKQTQEDSFQKSDLIMVESLFNILRNLELDKQSQDFFNNYLSFENLDLLLNFTEVRLLIINRKYKKAAEILTKILEEKKRIISHYKYLIVDTLYSIFNSQKIESSEIKNMKLKLSSELKFHVQIVISSQMDNKQEMKLLQLTSNLISNVLTRKGDKVSITLIDQSDNYIQTYLPLIQSTKISNLIGQIIKDIILLTNNQEEFSKIFQITCELFEENKQFFFQNQNDSIKKIQSSQRSNLENSKQSYFENESDQVFQQNQYYISINQNLIEKQNQENDTSLSHQISKKKIKKKNYQALKLQQSEGDHSDRFDNSDYFIQNVQENSQFQQKNDLFHFVIRKVISQFIQNQIYLQITKNESTQYIDNQNIFKYVIYCTNSIQLFDNKMFKLLCKLLVRFKIKLIIYAQQKSMNFIEQQEDQIYVFDNCQVIRVFYEPQLVLNYLSNLRSQFNQNVYATIIQNH